jgi:hypothetical protein
MVKPYFQFRIDGWERFQLNGMPNQWFVKGLVKKPLRAENGVEICQKPLQKV